MKRPTLTVVVETSDSNPVNHGVVNILRDALAMAERGEIDHVFIAHADKDGGVGGMYDGKPSNVILAAERLMRRLHEYLDRKEAEG